MSELKIVIVGAGFAGRVVHLPGYKAARAPVAAICDLDEDRARVLAERNGISRVYGDWRQMLTEEKPDVVSVCLPNVFHHQVTVAALEGGAHVICEKPLAVSVAQAREMFEAARKNKRHLMAAQCFRFLPGVQAIKRVVESGALGEIYHAEVNAVRRFGIPLWGAFHRKDASAGGCLLDIGVHMLDQAIWLMGNPRPVKVSAIVQTRFGNRPEIAAARNNAWDPARFDVDDFAVAFVRFESGASMVLNAAWASFVEKNEFNSRLLGTKAGVTTDPPTIFGLREGRDVDEIFRNLPEVNYWEAEMVHFMDVIRGKAEPIVREEETMNVQRILNAAYRSSEEGREVEVEE